MFTRQLEQTSTDSAKKRSNYLTAFLVYAAIPLVGITTILYGLANKPKAVEIINPTAPPPRAIKPEVFITPTVTTTNQSADRCTFQPNPSCSKWNTATRESHERVLIPTPEP